MVGHEGQVALASTSSVPGRPSTHMSVASVIRDASERVPGSLFVILAALTSAEGQQIERECAGARFVYWRLREGDQIETPRVSSSLPIGALGVDVFAVLELVLLALGRFRSAYRESDLLALLEAACDQPMVRVGQSEGGRLWVGGSDGRLFDSDRSRLESENAGSREDAMQELAASVHSRDHSDEARFHLATFASADPSPAVRQQAVASLGSRGEPPRTALSIPTSVDAAQSLLAKLAIEWIEVPGGTFTMGCAEDDPDSLPEERPAHSQHVADFEISRFHVTRKQWLLYSSGDSADCEKPDHPVTFVSWYEAVAFCEWLSALMSVADESRVLVELPSEVEWEYAARGPDGHRFPWGNELQAGMANVRSEGRGGPSPVGEYSPHGDSVFGCADMAGNSFEWTRSLWGRSSHYTDFPYPYDPADGREDMTAPADVRRVVRGGAHYYFDECVRGATRNFFFPWIRHSSSGFRPVRRLGVTLKSRASRESREGRPDG